MKNVERSHEETYKSLRKNLKKYHKCMVVRPTGWGKTWMLTRLIEENCYKKVVFFYVANVIKNTVVSRLGGNPDEEGLQVCGKVFFVSYAKLARMDEAEMEIFKDADLFITDECHKLGGKVTYTKMKRFMEITGCGTDKDFVGATATPERSDMINIMYEFFQNVTVSYYSLHDAFTDGLFHKPYYCYCTYGKTDLKDIRKNAEKEIKKCDKDLQDAQREFLNEKLTELKDISGMPNIIRETCDKYVGSSYMKFIVFFQTVAELQKGKRTVISWFKKSFPKAKIRSLVITSETKETRDNVQLLRKMTADENTVDLIFCINMLNLGYHVDNLSGIMMCRGTHSGIIFSQQVGRVLSVSSKKPGIVFDVVDNLHMKHFYDVRGIKNDEVEVDSDEEILDYDGPEDEVSGEDPWMHVNDLTEDDFIAVGHEAEYREFVEQIMMEPNKARSLSAFNLWIQTNEKEGKMIDKNTLKRKDVFSMVPPKYLPLDIFCRIKDVGIESTLNFAGIK